MELIKFPSIKQFRNVVYDVNHNYTYVGKDDNGEPIYDPSKKKPILTFEGSTKLHGTHAGICYNDKKIWYQSHKQIITPQKDNAGFAFFAESKKDAFIKIFKEIKEKNQIDTSKETICLYGEWAGMGIQKKVAISNIPKTFFIFGIKISSKAMKQYEDGTAPEEVKIGHWVDCTEYRDNENRIYNVHDFKKYTIDIDFNHPELSQNKIIEQTLEVEDCCPVAKEFGFEGIGEGIVYTCNDGDNRYVFKSKGIKHQKSKVKTLNKVDEEKVNKLRSMAEQVTPEWRL